MGGLSRKSQSIQLKMKRKRQIKLRQLKTAYRKMAAAERAIIIQKAHTIAPFSNTEAYLKSE